jgi:hypothetical protein
MEGNQIASPGTGQHQSIFISPNGISPRIHNANGQDVKLTTCIRGFSPLGRPTPSSADTQAPLPLLQLHLPVIEPSR